MVDQRNKLMIGHESGWTVGKIFFPSSICYSELISRDNNGRYNIRFIRININQHHHSTTTTATTTTQKLSYALHMTTIPTPLTPLEISEGLQQRDPCVKLRFLHSLPPGGGPRLSPIPSVPVIGSRGIPWPVFGSTM